MGHRLPNYDGLCASLHGHGIKAEVTVRATEGFLDFKDIHKWLAFIMKDLDHALVLYEHDPLVPLLQKAVVNPKSKEYQRLVLLNVEPTTENVAQLIMNEMSTYCHVENVVLHETEKYQAVCNEVQDESNPQFVRRLASEELV